MVHRIAREVRGAEYPMLTCTNYDNWVVLMKVML